MDLVLILVLSRNGHYRVPVFVICQIFMVFQSQVKSFIKSLRILFLAASITLEKLPSLHSNVLPPYWLRRLKQCFSFEATRLLTLLSVEGL